MRVVDHDFDSNLNWVEVIANAIGAVVEGNTIKGDNDLCKGMYLISEIEKDVVAVLIDITYRETVLLKYKSDTDTSSICLCFYLFNFDVDLILDRIPAQLGKLDYNFLMVDGILNLDYIVKKQTGIYAICIIIKKTALKEYLNKIHKFTDDIFFNSKKNTIIDLDRMQPESLVLIDNFRKILPDSPFYDMSFKALVYKLINNYLEQVKTKKRIIGKAVNEDVKRIIVSQKYLQDNDEGVFPGIEFLANQALMSTSKYKKMFTKILGLSPAVYFYNSKLEKAKELLGTRQYTVGEIADKLNYSGASYFSKEFSKRYGVLPKEYQNLL